MKNSKQIAEHVLKARDEYREKQKSKNEKIKRITAFGTFGCTLMTVIICAFNLLPMLEENEIEVIPPHSIEQEYTTEETTEVVSESQQTETSLKTTENYTYETSVNNSTSQTKASDEKNNSVLSFFTESINAIKTTLPVTTTVKHPQTTVKTTQTTIKSTTSVQSVTAAVTKPSLTEAVTNTKPWQTNISVQTSRTHNTSQNLPAIPNLTQPSHTETTTYTTAVQTIIPISTSVTTVDIPITNTTSRTADTTVITVTSVITENTVIYSTSATEDIIVTDCTTAPNNTTAPTTISVQETIVSTIITKASTAKTNSGSGLVSNTSVIITKVTATNTAATSGLVTVSSSADTVQTTVIWDDATIKAEISEIYLSSNKTYSLQNYIIDSSELGEFLRNCTFIAYNTLAGERFAVHIKIYEIKGIDSQQTIAVKFTGNDNYYVYSNLSYVPEAPD